MAGARFLRIHGHTNALRLLFQQEWRKSCRVLVSLGQKLRNEVRTLSQEQHAEKLDECVHDTCGPELHAKNGQRIAQQCKEETYHPSPCRSLGNPCSACGTNDRTKEWCEGIKGDRLSSFLCAPTITDHASTYLLEFRMCLSHCEQRRTASGALPPRPARKRNAMSWPSFCANPQPRFHATPGHTINFQLTLKTRVLTEVP